MSTLAEANEKLQRFKNGSLSNRIASLENALKGKDKEACESLCLAQNIGEHLLKAALELKRATSQIDEVVHALGVLLSLPYILGNRERVETLSLAAGNTGKPFDLETDQRVAEFKFIEWKGGPESIRQNQLFKDFFFLAEFDTCKERYLYVLGEEYPLRFLKGGRALSSVMSRNTKLSTEFRNRYGSKFSRVCEYYDHRRARVKVVDLQKVAPYFAFGLDMGTGDESEGE